jgi:ABC-type lipoprotein release transport system permease subunit
MNPLSTWTYFSRHKRHTILIISLSMIVTIGLYSLVALVWGVFVEPGYLAYTSFSEFSLVTVQAAAEDLQASTLIQLQSNPDVEKIMQTTFIRVELPGLVPGHTFQFDLLGLNEEDLPILQKRFASTLVDGRNPRVGAPEIVLTRNVANMLDLRVGDLYTATNVEFYPGMGNPKPTTFEVVGILEGEIDAGIVSLEYLNKVEQYQHFPHRLLVFASEGRKGAVDSYLRSEILSWETDVKTEEMLEEFLLNEALPGLLLLLPVVLIIGIAFSLVTVAVNQFDLSRRLPEIGILYATGRNKRWLGRRLTKESASLALIGWVLGVTLTWGILNLLQVTVFENLGHHLDYPIWLPLVYSIPVPVAVAGFTARAVRKTLTRLDPIEVVERRELSQEGDHPKIKTGLSSSINPLNPLTFYQRHRQRATLLISSMGLMILAVVLFTFTIAVGADVEKSLQGYLGKVSLIRSHGMVHSLDPEIPAMIETHPAVNRVIPIAPRYNMLKINIPPFNSVEASPFAVYHSDMIFLVDLYRLTIKAGYLPNPGTNEMVIPETLAKNRGLKVGDVIGDPHHPAYPNAPSLETEFVISGIFANTPRSMDQNPWAFISLEYLEQVQAFELPEVLPMIVVPQEGQKEALDNYLETEIGGMDASVVTQELEIARIEDTAKQDMLSIAMLEVGIAILAAIGLTIINYFFITQRRSEFGLLNALGFNHKTLVRRVFRETAFLVGIAWGISVIVGLGGLIFLRFVIFAPLGLSFNLVNITPWLFTLPIPIAVLVVTTGTLARTLYKFDPVAVIERRE